MTTDGSTVTAAQGRYDIVAIASSAGGIAALTHVLGALPAKFPVPVVLVQHLDRRHDTVLAEVLGRRTELPVTLAHDQQQTVAGTVYVAPPNHHLLVSAAGLLTLSSSELVHFVRPSADLLFESVADAYGAHALACVLTGSGRDGATGVQAIKTHGGTVIVEDPTSAAFKGMPESAVAAAEVDFVRPLHDIGTLITDLVRSHYS